MPEPRERDKRHGGNKPLVLLVEDDRLTRMVLKDIMRQCGYNVDIAENGEVALKKLHAAAKKGKAEYKLVLTDIFMPKINGEQLIASISGSTTLAHIPVAVMSSNDSEQDVKRLLAAGAADYLVKPVSKQKLERLARHIAPFPHPAATATPTTRPREADDASTATPPSKLARVTDGSARICDSLLVAAQAAANSSLTQEPRASATSSDQSQHTSSGPQGGIPHLSQLLPKFSPLPAHPAPSQSASIGGQLSGPPSAAVPAAPSAAQVTSTPQHAATLPVHGDDATAMMLANQNAVGQLGTIAPNSKGQVMIPVLIPGRGGAPSSFQYLMMPQPQALAPNAGAVAKVERPQRVDRNGVKAEDKPDSDGTGQTAAVQVPVLVPPTAMAAQLARKAALERFRAKKARACAAPKVRYQARKKLAEARPRYKGQFIKLDALPPGASWDPPKHPVA